MADIHGTERGGARQRDGGTMDLSERLARYQPNRSDPEHAETYRLSVELALAWIGQPGGVEKLRGLYAESRGIEREGAPRQATHRRGLVHVLAAWLSEQASQEAAMPVVVSPAEARPVLDSSPESGAVFTSGRRAEVGDAIAAAITRQRRELGGDTTDGSAT